MRSLHLSTALLCLVLAVDGRVSTNPADARKLEVMEALRATPDGWREVGEPDADQRMTFRIAMQQPNPALFHQTILEISDPGHQKYGQHLKRDELKALTRPTQQASDLVIEWLHSGGISDKDIQDDGDFINFAASISKAEEMFDTRFHVYESLVGAVRKTRTLRYSVPMDLHRYIDMISPAIVFGQIRPARSLIHETKVLGPPGKSAVVDASCNGTITPTCLRELYNINFVPDAETSGFISVNGFLNELARFDDLEAFEALYAPWAINQTFNVTSLNGGITDQESRLSATEANLDIQYTLGLTSPMRNQFYSTGGLGELVPDLDQPNQAANQNEPYLELFTFLTNLPDDELPHTLSTSYGEDEQSVPANYTSRVCDLIGGLGARGMSVIFSSGDTGVGSACQTNDGKNTTRFLPVFPAACPYVTSVGGTTLVEPEVAVGFSSGGFSDRFPRPDYQTAAVEKYLGILGDQWEGLYNPEGRGFPDIAAQSEDFHVINNGRDSLVSGTSASAPTVAGIVALLNGARLEQGLPPLGFLNPWLYSEGVSGLNDIVNGGSRGCTGRDNFSGLTTPIVPFASWNATEGWDPVTGLGTPDFAKLLSLTLGQTTSAKPMRGARSMRQRRAL